MDRRSTAYEDKSSTRALILGVLFVFLGIIFIARLFYIQVIRYDYYQSQALGEQNRKFEIAPKRGEIYLSDIDRPVALALNETKYILYSDNAFVKDIDTTIDKLSSVISVPKEELREKLSTLSRYQIIAKKVSKEQKESIEKLELSGIAMQEQSYRTYPQGGLASQLLGFVNDEQEGQYGVEQYFNEELSGEVGMLEATTDVRGVPLAVNDNIVKQPKDGEAITLTIDLTMQRIAEEALKNSVESTKANSGGVVIIEANTGAVKAMANYPTYDPAKYTEVSDSSLYKNKIVTDGLEVGSIMKTLTVAAVINEGLIGREGTYYDPGTVVVDGLPITNAVNFGSGDTPVYDILRNSLNTGATQMLALMGGGEINETARQTWYRYLTDKYGFGKPTGIEQPGESEGYVPSPTDGYALNFQYANTSFGQGLRITPLQMAAAVASIVNGGTYYKPYVVKSITKEGRVVETEPLAIRRDVISKSASDDMVVLMKRYTETNNRDMLRAGFSVGGKTGTAEVPDGNGAYKKDYSIGTFAGFVGGATPEYVIIVRVDEPKNGGFAGSAAARPLFNTILTGLYDNYPLVPSGQ